MANDLCVLHRDPSSQPDWLKVLPDCSISSGSPGPYNIAPFLFWGSLITVILVVIATVVIYTVRSDWKKQVNMTMVRQGMPAALSDIGALQKQVKKIEKTMETQHFLTDHLGLDTRLKKIEQYVGGG